MTVAELEDRMSYAEFLEWVDFYSRDPWGEYRADIRNAMLAALTANIHRRPRSRAFRLDEFMPNFLTERSITHQKQRQQLLREWFYAKMKQQEKKGAV